MSETATIIVQFPGPGTIGPLKILYNFFDQFRWIEKNLIIFSLGK